MNPCSSSWMAVMWLCCSWHMGMVTASATAGSRLTIPDSTLPQTGALPVPSGFMGLSHEPMSLAGYYASDPVYQQLLLTLTSYNTGALHVRWGGALQDIEGAVFPDAVWEGMKSVWSFTGGKVVHTIALNLMANSTQKAIKQVQNAQRILPAAAVYAVNIGNEPDTFVERGKRPREWLTGPASEPGSYASEELAYMEAVAPTLVEWLGTARVFSGPALTKTKDYPTRAVAGWASTGQDTQSGGGYPKFFTMHYYVASAKDKNKDHLTAEYLLSEDQSTKIYRTVAAYVVASHKAGLTLRLDETNSISNQGVLTVSARMAAALWLIDHSLNMAQAGVEGLNLHSSGCSTYSAMFFPQWCGTKWQAEPKFRDACPATCGQANAPAIPSAPYFGMWFMQQAFSDFQGLYLLPKSLNQLLRVSEANQIKAYVLYNRTEVRIVLLNKAGNGRPVNLDIEIAGNAHWGPATAWRLLSTNGTLSARVETMSFGGQTINLETGQREGWVVTETYQPTPFALGKAYTVSMPPASAALLVVRNLGRLE